MRIRSILSPLLLVSSVALVAACGGGSSHDIPACPEGGTDLTYDSFGKDFFGNYCTSCHSEGSGVAEAQDRPFDSLAGIQAEASDIYEEAAAEHTDMPPSGNKAPTAAERADLAEWLSCGAK